MAVVGSTKGLVSRFYQLKTEHPLTGQYLHRTMNQTTPQCWWCRYRTQTWNHHFKECKECLEWKSQQKIRWAEMREETDRRKARWKIRDLLVDGRCSRAGLDFLSATDVGRQVPAEEDDAVSVVSELEVWVWMRSRKRGPKWRAPGRHHCSSPHPTSWHLQKQSRGGRADKEGVFSWSFSYCWQQATLSFVSFPWCVYDLLGTGLGRGQRGTSNEPPLRGQQTGIGVYILLS